MPQSFGHKRRAPRQNCHIHASHTMARTTPAPCVTPSATKTNGTGAAASAITSNGSGAFSSIVHSPTSFCARCASLKNVSLSESSTMRWIPTIVAVVVDSPYLSSISSPTSRPRRPNQITEALMRLPSVGWRSSNRVRTSPRQTETSCGSTIPAHDPATRSAGGADPCITIRCTELRTPLGKISTSSPARIRPENTKPAMTRVNPVSSTAR